jgi:hypothetical protein
MSYEYWALHLSSAHVTMKGKVEHVQAVAGNTQSHFVSNIADQIATTSQLQFTLNKVI